MRPSWLAILALLAVSGIAQETSPETARYDGHRLVAVKLESEHDLRTMLTIGGDHWSETLGVGTFLFRVPPDALPDLARSGLTYSIEHEDVQELIDAEREVAAAAGLWYSGYRDYAQISSHVDGLVAQRPDLASRVSLGQSLEGRDVFALRITGPDGPGGKPAVLINALQHAREWVTGMTVVYVAEQLVTTYDTDPEVTSLLDDAVVWIVPVCNPDGYVWTWGPDRLWRKNRRDNGDGTFGVDTNRNFAAGWGGPGSSGNPDAITYRGPSPFSEPETQHLRDFLLAHPEVVIHLDVHNYSQKVLSPYGYDSIEPAAPDQLTFESLNREVAEAIHDVFGTPFEGGPSWSTLGLASGTFKDWTFDVHGAWSWTLELRPATANPGFLLPANEILPTAQETLAGVKHLIDFARRPMRFDLFEELPEIVREGEPTPVDLQVTEIGATLEPGSARIVAVPVSGPVLSIPLVPQGASRFTANLPPVPCGETLGYAFEARTVGGELVRDPEDPDQLHRLSAVRIVTSFHDDIELDVAGWTAGSPGDTATAGAWTRAVPDGTSGAPTEDHTPGAGTRCWVTGVGSDVDGGFTTLTSPSFDGRRVGARLSYWRWTSNQSGPNGFSDLFTVRLSNDDGQSWITVEFIGPGGEETAGGWIRNEIVLADGPLTPTDRMRLRFVASDSGLDSTIEAALDDVRVTFRPGCLEEPAIERTKRREVPSAASPPGTVP